MGSSIRTFRDAINELPEDPHARRADSLIRYPEFRCPDSIGRHRTAAELELKRRQIKPGDNSKQEGFAIPLRLRLHSNILFFRRHRPEFILERRHELYIQGSTVNAPRAAR